MKKTIFILLLISCSNYAQQQYRFFINNINLPINNKGTLGNVYGIPGGELGRYDGIGFLFSGGFMLSGYNNDTLWACAQATASLIENFIPGNVGSNPFDPRNDIYAVDILSSNINYEEWNRYKFAVMNGAEYYEGDQNGFYDPIDHNNNHKWDQDEDKPFLLGKYSRTAWCVYNDGIPSSQRLRFAGVNPQGIEIQQAILGYFPFGTPQLQDVLFIRYKIKNIGTSNSVLDSVYFGAWSDPDLGVEFEEDLTACDTLVHSGFVYNGDGYDTNGFGAEIPAFFTQILQGPQSYLPGKTFVDINSNGVYDDGIDTPLDTAYNKMGKDFGVEMFPGAVNLGMSSFINYFSSDPVRGDPDDKFEARNYTLGLLTSGDTLFACNDNPVIGSVIGGVNCNLVNPFYWYSGDPVTAVGWILKRTTDQRMMINTGPFRLELGKPVTIIVAYIVTRGTDRFNSITKAREIASFTQAFYNSNFDDNLVSVEDNFNVDFDEFKLFQNYPNPFNPSTRIQYQVSSSSYITLKVYDILGNEIATLVNDYKPAGRYEVEFDVSSGIRNLVSGIYMYQLRVGEFVETKKMLLLR